MSEKNHSVDSSNATKPEDNLQAVLDKIKRLEKENQELKVNQPILVSKERLRSALSAARMKACGLYHFGVLVISSGSSNKDVTADEIWEQLNNQ